MTDRAYILDTSKWNPDTIPWAVFVENGVVMGITKSSMGGGPDTSCNAHVEDMKVGGAKVGLYHWLDPTQDCRTQFGYFLAQIEKHKPNVIAYDIEQWWANWAMYYEYMKGQRPSNTVPRIGEAQWVDFIDEFRGYVQAETDYEQNDRALAYWAKWVWELYKSISWSVRDLPQWIANYILSGKPRRVTWDQLHAIPAAGASPALPGNILSWKIWQFSSLLILPGVDYRLDTNIFNGSKADFFAWLDDGPMPEPEPALSLRELILALGEKLLAGENWRVALTEFLEKLRDPVVEPPPEPPPPPPVQPLWKGKVTATAMHVRSGPGLDFSILGYVIQGDVVDVWEVEGTWARISPGGTQERWCSTKWLQEVA